MNLYRVFTRTWWKHNASWPNGLEPCPGRKHYMRKNLTEEEARSMCKHWNATHNPGCLSKKAEYESQP